MAVTVDQQIEGIHFPAGLSARSVGRRLVAVNMSDIAAVGGRPTFGFLTASTPKGFRTKTLLAAVEEELGRHGARLAGGDLARSRTLSTTLTLLAERAHRGRWLRRSSARPGDRLWVGGPIGASALGRLLLAAGASFERGRPRLSASQTTRTATAAAARRAIRNHLQPEAQLDLGTWLSRRSRAAAIDISDGLLLDLRRLCRESQVGAEIDASRLPPIDRLDECASMVGADPMDLMLAGGEDYVLLFALPPRVKPPERFNATVIGTVRDQPGIELRGAETPRTEGWDHFAFID